MALNRWLQPKKPGKAQKHSSISEQEKKLEDVVPTRDNEEEMKKVVLKKKIREILAPSPPPNLNTQNSAPNVPPDDIPPVEDQFIEDFLTHVNELRVFLNARSYLRADIDTVARYAQNLANIYEKIVSPDSDSQGGDISRNTAREQLREVPRDFLTDRQREVLRRVIAGKKTKTDYYQIKKLKDLLVDKLREFRHWQFLATLLDVQG